MKQQDKHSHIYVMFRVDDRKNMYKADLTIDSSHSEVVEETIRMITEDIKKYLLEGEKNETSS